MNGNPRREDRRYSVMAGVAFVFALIAMLVIVAGVFSARMGIVAQLTGFGIFAIGQLLALAALLVSLVGLMRTRHGGRAGRGRAVAGLTLSVILLLPLAFFLPAALRVPPIHDITTDTQDPPQFDALAALRTEAENDLTYAGPPVANLQQEAYPDIAPLVLPLSPAQAFKKATSVAAELGWQIVSADPETGHIEAVDETLLFGFKDDIAIRITTDETGAAKIDIRSASRVGESDLGANARRIKQFMQALQDS
ncbi:MAG TPA: DUF1499 domain-containing protein [Alphaproteobacteria bacterium]|nr:DUF1499 domain-containing protein [Alphaproteobacteria bacterium]HBA42412.1 DUF1499 domain-containing protein [Alphaproteobacteria bacterium]